MSLLLVENHPLQTTFRHTQLDFEKYYDPNYLYQEITGSTNLVFHCKNLSSKGKGVDSNNRFPWTVSPLAFSQRLRGKNGFSLHIYLSLHKPDEGNCWLMVRVDGDFLEILQYVFNNVSSKISKLKMNLCASLRFPDNTTTTIPCEMTATKDKSGNVTFEQRSQISVDVGDMFVKASGQVTFAALTVELVGVDLNKIVTRVSSSRSGPNTTSRQIEDVLSASSAATSLSKISLSSELEKMTKGIYKKKLLSDYALVAKTGKVFRCNKVFLAARSPLFEAFFMSETEKGPWKQLQLSDEGVNALLKFVYYSNIKIPEKNPGVALELLEIASVLQIPSLEKAMKKVYLCKPDNWLDLEKAKRLYICCAKLKGYEDLTKKAANMVELQTAQLQKEVGKKKAATQN